MIFFFFFFKQKTAYEIMPSLVGSEMCIRDSYQGELLANKQLEIILKKLQSQDEALALTYSEKNPADIIKKPIQKKRSKAKLILSGLVPLSVLTYFIFFYRASHKEQVSRFFTNVKKVAKDLKNELKSYHDQVLNNMLKKSEENLKNYKDEVINTIKK
eukprot:TRINITY_DN3479_c0_g1_i2.p1 TRINITY_DN3479_c0_g1~~TRINITY_DN3479_c0_g1_i2.p1  ORF type:complete len:158 (+),score=41.95 TRINITY_DN3479_c0_g1_i2:53-526(+)